MQKSTLCDYSDAYILVSGTITITGAGADDNAKRLDDCTSEINNTQIAQAKDLDILMPMYNLKLQQHIWDILQGVSSLGV